MATTNFDPSIYNIQQTINEIAKQYMPDQSDDTLALGLFGYIEDIASLQIQNDIILNSELGNELWPSRAKYEKNIIAHSIIQNITDINAKPAIIQVMIGFEEEKIKPLFKDDLFTIDKEYAFRIGNFEFHLEYDIKLQRSIIANQQYVYSARYDMNRKNNLSKIVNPYTYTPYIQLDQGKRMIYIPCQLMQVTHVTEYKKVITSSSIDNKTFEFTFEDQLAGFEVYVKERGITTYLTPVFDGAGIENNIDKYCFYTYIDSKTIRVRFDSSSYLPTLNADVEIYIKTTKGEEGNFEYEDYIYNSISSDIYGYKNFPITMKATGKSTGGEDRKTVEELRRLLPKEALSRGSITTLQDLKNYFNTMILDSNMTRIEVMKKISNDFEKRSYYAYIIMKNEDNNIIPTNTIDIEIPKSMFDTHDNRKYVIKPGSYIVYENGIGHIYQKDSSKLQELLKDDTNNLIYSVPFMLVVNADPLYVSYYLSMMNYPAYLIFDWVNQLSQIQFICTNVVWTRKFLTDSDTYFLDMYFSQNISDGENIITVDEKGNIIDSRMKVIMVMYNDDNITPYRYAIGEITDSISDKYHIQFKFTTTDQINDYNMIKINDVYTPNTTAKEYGYFTNHISAKLYVLFKYNDNKEYGKYDLNSVVPKDLLDGWTVTNMYTIDGGLNFYYNYSQIMSSLVSDTSISSEYGDELGFKIRSVPVIKHSYINNEHNIQELINMLNYEKAYIDNATYLLENNFLVDFKFFNTYGKSKLYSTDKLGNNLIDRIHITLNFEVKLLKTSDNNTKDYIINDIKKMIEDLNDMESLHIPNLITTITNTYRNSIVYIEFMGFNDYGPAVQHLYRQENNDITAVPEFLNINMSNKIPDINITLV